MKVLNLANSEKSEINFKTSKFPDGQQQVVILNKENLYTRVPKVSSISTSVIVTSEIDKVLIKSRLNNFFDLELIICAVASLRELEVKEISLYVPYFLGARSDRKFEEGSNNYLKTVICPIINSLGFESVTTIDPHSDVLEACLNNFKKEDNINLVKYFFRSLPEGYNTDAILISPDAGASKKIYNIAEKISYKENIIICSKSRDTEGKLTKTIVPLNEEDSFDKDFIIVDDICDGGRTFINIVEAIKSCKPGYKGKIYLIVTHGIFSNGFKELNKYFDGIYCTNSVVDMNDPEFSLKNDNQFHKLKQLNVF